MVRPISAQQGAAVGPTSAAAPADATGQSRPQAPDKLKEAAQEFEAIFVEMLMKRMRAANHALSDEKTGFARDTYESWQDEEMARGIARAGGTGLAEILYRQLQQQQIGPILPADQRKNPTDGGNTTQ